MVVVLSVLVEREVVRFVVFRLRDARLVDEIVFPVRFWIVPVAILMFVPYRLVEEAFVE